MLQYDRRITISAAGSRKSTRWPAQKIYWSEMLQRLQTPARSSETLQEYLALSKSKQDDLKDVGGFVAGELHDGRRKAGNVMSRDVLTLDLDNIPAGKTQDVLRKVEALGCAYAVYSTRKHEEARPRLRLLVPLSRTAAADEYEPLARKLAAYIGVELCDATTFQALRMMYWPSCCVDSQYVYVYGDKPFLDTDGMLSTYTDWRNVGEWPVVPGAQEVTVKRAAQQGDPTGKNGVIGAFCRIFDVYKLIPEFLADIYVPCDDASGRFTFTGGSTVGGAVVYDNGNFLFSHHATDPAGGKLCNSFDLLRLHKFGSLDDDAKPDTPSNKLPSYVAMCEFAVQNSYVAALLNQERYEKATAAFSTPEEDNANWIRKLAVSPNTAAPAKTTDNVLIILENDPLLKNKIAFDEFANRGVVLGQMPWNTDNKHRQWSDVDDAGLRHYLERTYGITGKDRVFDATALCAHKHTFNEVKTYLSGLSWDGVARLDMLLVDYLGAKDTPYTRAVARKFLAAAVARAMEPGIKFDTMPIFAGPQGLGKSTLLRMLGKKWFSDSLQTFEGKEAAEMIQGTWINELGELNGMNKAESNAVKQFMSKNDDIYREPFGRRTNKYPRRCVFAGTTNDSEFLKDQTGNRRFWPVDVGRYPVSKSVFTDLPGEVDQIWAEAYVRWQLGEELHLKGEVEAEAIRVQEGHREASGTEGLIREFLEREVPVDWEKRNLNERRLYWSGDFNAGNVETMKRTQVCAMEVWCECLNGDAKFMDRKKAMEINRIIDITEGWVRSETPIRFKAYGLQKGRIKLLL